MRLLVSIAICLALAGDHLLAQATTNASGSTAADPPLPLPNPAEDKAWSGSVSAYTYLLPDSPAYAQPTLAADHGWLHLEARYNYEALDTGSAWVGYNFSGGEKLAWEFTPMLGGVFGATTGMAPGYKGSLSWWKLELYSEGEYVCDTGNSADSYLYNWSELTLAPLDWFRFGLVTQRTRTSTSDRNIQRGVMVGFTYKMVGLSGYWFDPDAAKPTFVIAVALTF